MPQTRQLAAIMFTDIEGYSALMQRNEIEAITIRNRHRQVVESEHTNCNGKVIDYFGDGTLSIFTSAVQAVQCAIAMQKLFSQLPIVPVRIGLHMGDIIVNDGHVFGDGVNVASRVESMGVAGSVLISDKINDELQNQPEYNTMSMGFYHFKNIEREMEIFAIVHEGLTTPIANTLQGKTEAPKVNGIPKNSVAVLPFVNMSNDPEQEYFSEGMAEEILNSLAHIADLKVAGRTSSFQLKDKNVDLHEIGQKLGVSTILEGSVRKQGHLLRVTVQLINIEDGFHLWSEKYDRQMDDIFAVQDEIALAVTEKFKITLIEKEMAVISNIPTENKVAYDLYLRGRFYWSKRGIGLLKAIEYFLQAAELDPDFTEAQIGIADTYALFAFYSLAPPHVAIPKARQAAERAIQLNPGKVEPISVLGYITTVYDWDWAEAKRLFENAIAINPDYAPARYWYSNYLSWIEKNHEHSEAEAKKAIELEPLMSHSYNTIASVYLCSGNFEDARKANETAIELDPNSFLAYTSLAAALHGLGRIKEAIETINFALSISARHQYALLILSWLYAESDRIADAQQIFDELLLRSKTEFISGLALATAAYYSKNEDQALAFMEKAFEERVGLLPSMSVYPFFAFVKKDPRFQPFLERLKYPLKII